MNIDLSSLANLAYLSSLINKKPSESTNLTTLINPINTTNPNNPIPEFKRFWPNPNNPLNLYNPAILNINPVYEYQNINKDVNLRKDVTEYYYNELMKWISTDKQFSKFKSMLSDKHSVDNKMKLYHLLRRLVKKTSHNWYDLRNKYQLVREYLLHKL